MSNQAQAIFDYEPGEIRSMIDRMNDRFLNADNPYEYELLQLGAKTSVIGKPQEVMYFIGHAADEGHDFLISYTTWS